CCRWLCRVCAHLSLESSPVWSTPPPRDRSGGHGGVHKTTAALTDGGQGETTVYVIPVTCNTHKQTKNTHTHTHTHKHTHTHTRKHTHTHTQTHTRTHTHTHTHTRTH